VHSPRPSGSAADTIANVLIVVAYLLAAATFVSLLVHQRHTRVALVTTSPRPVPPIDRYPAQVTRK
jgi:hypothetical protein